MADKTKTIKNATDQELDSLILRLRKESEAQSLISSIKRRSTPPNTNNGMYDSYSSIDDSVSTDAPIESLYHEEVEEVLEHFGIPGMKWGHRKGISINLHERRQKKINNQSDEYKQSRELKSKSYKTLSNKELKALNERMQLERSLRDLKSSDYQKGLDAVKTLTAVGTTVASLYALSTTPLGQAVKTALTRKPSMQLSMFK